MTAPLPPGGLYGQHEAQAAQQAAGRNFTEQAELNGQALATAPETAPEPDGQLQAGQRDPEGLGRNFNPLRDPLGSDADMAMAVAQDALGGFCWAGGLGWRSYDRELGCWPAVPEEVTIERVRRWMLAMCAAVLAKAAQESKRGKDSKYYEDLATQWRRHATASRIMAITRLARGICRTDPFRFDAHPDLLNCPNGVADLRTGELSGHDPALLFTQVTGAAYVPGAEHEDVTKALEAIPADVRGYAQLRYGQGVTGHKPPDDAIDVQHGSGENGKTTIVGAIGRALGAYAAVLPARLLLASPDAHSTELMTLRGVRVGIIEELPEEHQLSVTRIKVATAPKITARLVHKDNVTFTNACTLIISTNYRPQIRETDHGTWRRLEGSIPFPYTFRKPHERLRDSNDLRGDGTLRQRMTTDQGGQRAEAMLAWLVKGAMAWYAGALTPQAQAAIDAGADKAAVQAEAGSWARPPMTMGEPPKRVRDDVTAWRESCDLLFAYMADRLVLGPGAHVISEELLTDMNGWLRRRGHREWSMETFTARFEVHSECREHGVAKIRPRAGQEPGLSRPPLPAGCEHPAPKQRYTAWWGVRFRDSQDEETAGGPGWSDPKQTFLREASRMGVSSAPDHPGPSSFRPVTEYDFAALFAMADFEAAEKLMEAGEPG